MDGVSRQVSGGSWTRARRETNVHLEAPSVRMISAKNLQILPKNVKESVDLPDFAKESVAQILLLS